MTDESEGLRIARDRIAREAEEQTGFLDLGMLGLKKLPEELFDLQHLKRLSLGWGMQDEGGEWRHAASTFAPNEFDTFPVRLQALVEIDALSLSGCGIKTLIGIEKTPQIGELACSGTEIECLEPISELQMLSIFYIDDTNIFDLHPLSKLQHISQLSFKGTKVSTLSDIAGLSSLSVLNCSETQICDLSPVTNLAALSRLYCFTTKIDSLAPVTSLSKLNTLYCFRTPIAKLSPIEYLNKLLRLSIAETKVDDLNPVSGLAELESLTFYETSVRDLTPVAKLTALQTLHCSNTHVFDLTPVSQLIELRKLTCAHTNITDLTPLHNLEKLQRLDLSECQISEFPRWLLDRSSLDELILYDSIVPGLPSEVLSQFPDHNCLASFRAHIRDREAEAEPVQVRDVKLLVLGNGRVGKTQLCRRLRGEGFDASVTSTHGIETKPAVLPNTDGESKTTLRIWDFGGQDIYHGTHALFMRTNAIFLLAWTPELEDNREEALEGIILRNQRLEYWVNFVHHLAGKRSAVVVVQTQCDQATDARPCPVTEADLFANFQCPPRVVRYSALNDRGRGALDEALTEAAAWLRDQDGIATIGAGRQRVKQKLEALRNSEASVPKADRQYRMISQEFFHQVCDEAGGVSSPEHLLAYLHNAGIVFYQDGLFGDAIILDQGWALDAIYAVFDREKSYKQIRRNKGRFTRSDLADWVWVEHGEEEQELFLSMMQSCGICFDHRPAASGTETEYIAPELLPERAEVDGQLADRWKAERPTQNATYAYAFVHPGLIRGVISRIGRDAGDTAVYWRGGVYGYDCRTASRVMIEANMIDACRGQIEVRTQDGRAAELLQQMQKLVEEEHTRAGMTPVAVTVSAQGMRVSDLDEVRGAEVESKASFVQEQSKERCVSYAWGDDTPEGRAREAIVDRLCEEAKARKTPIVRDKEAMKVGDRISDFMHRIGGAEVVFVILSDKYLKSPFCMFELWEVWRRSQLDEGQFLQRVRAYTLPCAKIRTLAGRASYAIHWKTQQQEVQALIDAHGDDILGDRDWVQFRWMKKFSGNVGDILATVADTLQPKDFDELVAVGFGD